MLATVGACGLWRTGRGLLIALALSVGTPAGFAAEPETTAPGAAEPPDPGTSIEPLQAEPAEAEAPEPKLLGDLGGLRPALDKYGIGLELGYIGETFGVVHGGVKRGAIYEGQASAGLSFDLEKMFGWPGAKIYANALQIHGRGASRAFLGGNLETVSNIEALPTTRLYRLYFEQSLFNDRASIRLGQIAADDEFITSDTASGLINGTFGWPALTAADTRGGGPAYPLPQPGVRLQVKPVRRSYLRAAAFTGNPGGTELPQRRPAAMRPARGLVPVQRRHVVDRAKPRTTSTAARMPPGCRGSTSSADGTRPARFPTSSTRRVNKRNNGGVYAVVDQGMWRRPGSDKQGLNFFMRIGGGPSDRNFLSFYADAGIGFRAPFVSRPDDVVTLGGGLRPYQRRCGARRTPGRLAE